MISIYTDCRGEIESRINQRDNFAIQFMTSTGVVLGVSCLDFSFAPYLFFLLPLITIFYSMQILYSYTIHDRLHNFLVEQLEPELAKLNGYSNCERQKLFWESYCTRENQSRISKNPGIRKGFFQAIPYVMTVLSSVLFALVSHYKGLYNHDWRIPLTIGLFVTAFFITIDLIIFLFWPQIVKKHNIRKLSKVDYQNDDILKDTRKKRAVFLDKDGTIYIDKVMTHKITDLEYFNDTFSSLRRLTKLGFILIICTNQNGIRKGKYTEIDMHAFHTQIIKDFKNQGIDLAAIYYSPYDAQDNNISYKPNFGMFIRAMDEFNIDMKNSYSIGDQITDIIASEKALVHPIMVTTGIYKNDDYKTKRYEEIKPVTVSSLEEAVDLIENDMPL